MVRKRVWLSSPFHNYADRRKVTLSAEQIAEFKLYEETNTHWNHGDFINAECVTSCPVPLNVPPNYMILYNGNQIESRWSVMDYTFLSGEPTNTSKFRASLMRDVVIDFRTNIDSELFDCRRGNLPRNVWSPFLVQPEGISLNEVKVDQKNIRMWDNQTNWLAIFYDVTANTADRTIEFEPTPENDFTFDDVQQQFANRGFTLTPEGSINTFNRYIRNVRTTITVDIQRTSWVNIPIAGWTLDAGTWRYTTIVEINALTGKMTNVGTPSIINVSGQSGGNRGPETLTWANQRVEIAAVPTSNFNTSNDTYVEDKANYKNEISNRFNNMLVSGAILNISTITDTLSNVNDNSHNGNLATHNMLNRWFGHRNMPPMGAGGSGMQVMALSMSNTQFRLTANRFESTFSELPQSGRMILPQDTRLDEIHLGCIAIPFGVNTSIINNGNKFTIPTSAIMSMATSGWTNVGTAVKDIQILPYCPNTLLNSFNNENEPSDIINYDSLPAELRNRDTVPMTTKGDEVMYYAISCRQSSMSLTYSVDFSNWFGNDIKLDSITKKVRLVSHNHAQYFEFRPTSNKGMYNFNISWTLRPQSTIYRITPVFDGLYGGNFTDGRGLIWEGGVSLPQITDAWTEHVLQNSTYRQIFDRDMQNLDITQNNQRDLEVLNMETNRANDMTNFRTQSIRAGAAAAGGALVGGLKAGPAGAAVGAAMGAAMAGVGLQATREIMDRNYAASRQALTINDAQRNENAAFKADIWNLNNQAIQARPGALAAGTERSILFNNKAYFELYDCTDEEKREVELKLRYNGMRIGRKGHINEFIQRDGDYVQGVMVFNQGMTPKICNAINAELSEGCYLEKTNETETIQ